MNILTPQGNKLQELLSFIEKKRFVTRGAPFAKKMWRDGYNKALIDISNFILLGYPHTLGPTETETVVK